MEAVLSNLDQYDNADKALDSAVYDATDEWEDMA